MLIEFSVQNFASIKDKQTLSFVADKSKHLEEHYVIQTNGLRLLKLALIYGANASGKTNILKALDFLRQLVINPLSHKNETIHFQPFLFDEKSRTSPTIFEIKFSHNANIYSYELCFTNEAILNEKMVVNKNTIYSRQTDPIKKLAQIKFNEKIFDDKVILKILETNTLWNNTVLGGYLKTNTSIAYLEGAIEWFSGHLEGLLLSSFLENFIHYHIYSGEIDKAILLDILKKADFGIDDIFIRELVASYISDDEQAPKYINDLTIEEREKLVPIFEVYFVHKISKNKHEKLPFQLESKGTQRFYELAGILTLLIKKSFIFPIDEIEASLHPDLLEHFLLMFLLNTKNSQIIATTHYREFLENTDIFRNDVIWFVQKDENLATELYSLADFDKRTFNKKTNILQSYKVGRLGAIPNLKGRYI
ncbi:AAA family ATPase [Raineya sp.]|jgi:hypothetical protein